MIQSRDQGDAGEENIVHEVILWQRGTQIYERKKKIQAHKHMKHKHGKNMLCVAQEKKTGSANE